MTDIQVVAIDGVDSVWIRFKSLGVRADFTRDEALELAQSLLEVAATGGDRVSGSCAPDEHAVHEVNTEERVSTWDQAARRHRGEYWGTLREMMALADAEVAAERQRLHDRIEALADEFAGPRNWAIVNRLHQLAAETGGMVSEPVDEPQCNHWNDRADLAGRTRLRPVRCQGRMGHADVHYCGGMAWSEHYGYRGDDDAAPVSDDTGGTKP